MVFKQFGGEIYLAKFSSFLYAVFFIHLSHYSKVFTTMTIAALTPQHALNKAFRKVKPNRTDIERFKTNLIQLLDHSNDAESEEFHKNLVSNFLKKTWYEPRHFINTKGRNDLVIHNGDNAKSSVGVIMEAKNLPIRPKCLLRKASIPRLFRNWCSITYASALPQKMWR